MEVVGEGVDRHVHDRGVEDRHDRPEDHDKRKADEGRIEASVVVLSRAPWRRLCAAALLAHGQRMSLHRSQRTNNSGSVHRICIDHGPIERDAFDQVTQPVTGSIEDCLMDRQQTSPLLRLTTLAEGRHGNERTP